MDLKWMCIYIIIITNLFVTIYQRLMLYQQLNMLDSLMFDKDVYSSGYTIYYRRNVPYFPLGSQVFKPEG